MKEINNYFRYFYAFKTQRKEKMKSSLYNIGFLAFIIVFSTSIIAQQKTLPKAKNKAF